MFRGPEGRAGKSGGGGGSWGKRLGQQREGGTPHWLSGEGVRWERVWRVGTCAIDGDIMESTVRSLLGYGTWNPTEDGVLPNCFYLGPITEPTVRRAAVALRTLS